MRKLRLNFSIDTPELEAFIFFALTLDEKLYDFTDDSFKAPALNTYTRTLELQAIAHTNFSAGLSKDALKPFIEELEWSISRDPALTPDEIALCKAQIESISLRAGESAQVPRAVAGLRLVLRNYFTSIQKTIKTFINSKPNKKSEIQELASNFVIQAELEGFPRRYTYHMVQKLLIKPLKYEKAIDIENSLCQFFDAFVPKARNFDCAFLVDNIVSTRKSLLKRFDFKCQSENPDWENLSTQQENFIDTKDATKCWLIAENVIATNASAAHEIVANRFDALASVIRFFEHKGEASLSRLSLTRDLETNFTYMAHEGPDPMHCWVGNLKYTEEDYIELSDAIHGGHLAEDSAMRLARALRFHKAALLSISKKDGIRIEHFSESILPTLTLTYPEKLFSSAYYDSLKIEPNIQSILKSIDQNGSDFSKFISLLLCEELTDKRDQFLTLIASEPLLRNKLWRLSQAFKSRTAIQETLKNHRKKMKWHLYRIYFTRNSLMHSATSLPYLSTLVENLHLYVDTLIRSIAKVAHESAEVLSIEGGLNYLSAWEKIRTECSTGNPIENSKPPTTSDAWSFVFGHDMILAPAQDKELIYIPR